MSRPRRRCAASASFATSGIDGVRLYWDANVFIRMVEVEDRVSGLLGRVQDAAIERLVSIHSSRLTLAELLVRPLRERDIDLIDTYRDLFRSEGWLDVAEVEHDVLLAAARLRADRGALRLPDAIHLATAELLDCTHVITGDLRLAGGAGFIHVDLAQDALEQLVQMIHEPRD